MKKNNLQIRIKGTKVININESSNLLYEIENGQITYEEALKRIGNIHNNINKIIKMQSLNSNQINLLNILFMVNEIFAGKSESVEVKEKQESDEEPGTTDMPELESEKSAADRSHKWWKGLKILTWDQMLSRLPITLAHLKAGNNS